MSTPEKEKEQELAVTMHFEEPEVLGHYPHRRLVLYTKHGRSYLDLSAEMLGTLLMGDRILAYIKGEMAK